LLRRLRAAIPDTVVADLGGPGDWDVESVLAATLMCEYDLLGVAEVGKSAAEVRFYARAYPYGGVGSLIRLVHAFGFDVVGFDVGTGYADFSAEDWPWMNRGKA
jgi:hypothetical protein